MTFFAIFGKWFWAICILVTFANALTFWSRARKHIQANPELEGGYRSLIKGFLFWGNVPWVIMGIGCVVGGVPSVFSYFRPRDGNPYVLAFFASIFLIWLLGTNWIVFRGGAEMLVKYPGFLSFDIKSPRIVVVFWLACLTGGILGTILIFTQNIVPPFPK